MRHSTGRFKELAEDVIEDLRSSLLAKPEFARAIIRNIHSYPNEGYLQPFRR